MKILFVHQNFPGQFKHLAPALARDPKNQVVAMRSGADAISLGVQIVGYQIRAESGAAHPYLADLNVKVIRAEAVADRAWRLKQDGFTPDVIVAHPGWGETLFLKRVWPAAKLGLYGEFFYGGEGSDTGFDPEFSSLLSPLADACRLQIKNANQLLAFQDAESGLSPTKWQRSRYPEVIASKIEVIHDGIDTHALCADRNVSLKLNAQRVLTCKDEIITFVSRNLEPYRGYHHFLRALPEILKRRPRARVLIVGGNGVSYGSSPPKGTTWRELFWNEVKDQIDTSRVHFVGNLPYNLFVKLLQLSSVHVYLTYPFVLSWSLLEAMSIECAIVASHTAPVVEVLSHDNTALLVNFFRHEEVTNSICRLLDDRALATRLGKAARQRVVEDYDLTRTCLPGQMEWVSKLAHAD